MRIVGLDVGSSSVRAVGFDERATGDGVLVQREHALGANGELDPDELLARTRAVLGEAGAADVVAVSTFWHSLLALDARGRPLTPVLGWRDGRAAEQAQAIARRLDPEAVRARTGCPLHPSFWPAKLLWLRETEPDAYARAARFVSFADWLVQQETGELRTSLSLASATGLHAGDGWDGELLAELELDESRLPPVADAPLGPWQPALGDGAAANLGVGAVGPRRAAATIGTSAALRVVVEDDAPPPPGLFRYRADRGRAVVGGSLSDGGNLVAWLAGLLHVDRTAIPDRDPREHGLVLLPQLGGDRSPGWRPDARGAIAGLTYETTPGDLLQAALEGVAVRLAELAAPLGVETVVASGGALRESALWRQLVADALGVPLLPSLEPEASARGAAVAALERAGRTPADARVGEPIAPRDDRTEAYRSVLVRQRHLYRGAT